MSFGVKIMVKKGMTQNSKSENNLFCGNLEWQKLQTRNNCPIFLFDNYPL